MCVNTLFKKIYLLQVTPIIDFYRQRFIFSLRIRSMDVQLIDRNQFFLLFTQFTTLFRLLWN